MPRSAILSPRQREEREVDEAETMRAHGQIAKSFAAKVLEVSTLISVAALGVQCGLQLDTILLISCMRFRLYSKHPANVTQCVMLGAEGG